MPRRRGSALHHSAGVFCLIEAVTRGFRLEEVPVRVMGRRHGDSKKPPAQRYGWRFRWAIISAWRRALLRGAHGRRTRRAPAVDRARVEPAGGSRERADVLWE